MFGRLFKTRHKTNTPSTNMDDIRITVSGFIGEIDIGVTNEADTNVYDKRVVLADGRVIYANAPEGENIEDGEINISKVSYQSYVSDNSMYPILTPLLICFVAVNMCLVIINIIILIASTSHG